MSWRDGEPSLPRQRNGSWGIRGWGMCRPRVPGFAGGAPDNTDAQYVCPACGATQPEPGRCGRCPGVVVREPRVPTEEGALTEALRVARNERDEATEALADVRREFENAGRAYMGRQHMSYSTYNIVQATTARALTADEWKDAWILAAPVVVAAGRYVEAQREGNPALMEDAHFQLLRALTDYTATYCPERDTNGRGGGNT